MKLYYSPGACSLAPHIALYEVGAKFDEMPVDLKTKTYSGGDFTKVNPKGYVPTLELDNGDILTEDVVVLQYIADQFPEANLIAKTGTMQRYRCLEWLSFIATELHKGFSPLWKVTTPEDYKVQVREILAKRFDILQKHLSKSSFICNEHFSVADAYLFTILNWTRFLKFDLSKWPALPSYLDAIKDRPSVRAALKSEGLLLEAKTH